MGPRHLAKLSHPARDLKRTIKAGRSRMYRDRFLWALMTNPPSSFSAGPTRSPGSQVN